MDAGGSKIPGVVQKRRSKTMGARARFGAGRDLPFTFFVSAASVGVEGERIIVRFKGLFSRGKVTGA